jgi:hypothetical protein
MDVEQTIQFILQSQAQMEANVGRHEEMLATLAKGQEQLVKSQNTLSASLVDLTGVMRNLAVAQAQTEEHVKDLSRMQRETREDLNIVLRTLDDLIRRKPE